MFRDLLKMNLASFGIWSFNYVAYADVTPILVDDHTHIFWCDFPATNIKFIIDVDTTDFIRLFLNTKFAKSFK